MKIIPAPLLVTLLVPALAKSSSAAGALAEGAPGAVAVAVAVADPSREISRPHAGIAAPVAGELGRTAGLLLRGGGGSSSGSSSVGRELRYTAFREDWTDPAGLAHWTLRYVPSPGESANFLRQEVQNGELWFQADSTKCPSGGSTVYAERIITNLTPGATYQFQADVRQVAKLKGCQLSTFVTSALVVDGVDIASVTFSINTRCGTPQEAPATLLQGNATVPSGSTSLTLRLATSGGSCGDFSVFWDNIFVLTPLCSASPPFLTGVLGLGEPKRTQSTTGVFVTSSGSDHDLAVTVKNTLGSTIFTGSQSCPGPSCSYTPRFNVTNAGIYDITVTVDDHCLTPVTSSYSLTVNDPPVAVCKLPQVAAVGATFEIDGGSYDPEGDDFLIIQEFYRRSVPGTYIVGLTVDGLVGQSDRCSSTVIVDYAPIAVCNSSIISVAVNERFDIDAGSRDPAGDSITKTQDAYSFPVAGFYDVRLTVTDSYNLSGTCDALVEVSSPLTKSPTQAPTSSPTKPPTNHPTNAPTNHPTKSPSNYPTKTPTNHPTRAPPNRPSRFPTNRGTTKGPTNHPARFPTKAPVSACRGLKGMKGNMKGCMKLKKM